MGLQLASLVVGNGGRGVDTFGFVRSEHFLFLLTQGVRFALALSGRADGSTHRVANRMASLHFSYFFWFLVSLLVGDSSHYRHFPCTFVVASASFAYVYPSIVNFPRAYSSFEHTYQYMGSSALSLSVLYAAASC